MLALLTDFEELDRRDVERMRGDSGKSFEARLYILIEQRIQEVLLLAGWRWGVSSTKDCFNKSAPWNRRRGLGRWMQLRRRR